MKRKTVRKIASTVLSVSLVFSGMLYQTNDVSAAKKVTKITLNKKSATLYLGAASGYSSITLKATVKPKNAAKVKFSTSNKKIATVSSKGLVKAKKKGKVTITAKVGNKKATCKITVKKITTKVKSVKVSKSKVTIYVGKTSKISAKITPSKATLKKLAYSTSNKKVATVSQTGVIKGVKAGTAKITVAAVDGSKKKATVSVTVKAKATNPTQEPTQAPTQEPTQAPTEAPTQAPTAEPTQAPTAEPTQAPTAEPTQAPTVAPTQAPTAEPTQAPTAEPTQAPTAEPTQAPTAEPTQVPSATPTEEVITPVIDNENNTATYNLSTAKSYKVSYKDGKQYSMTANDIDKITTYIDMYLGKVESSNGNLETGYKRFKEKIESMDNDTYSLTFGAGSFSIKYKDTNTNTDNYEVIVENSQASSINGTYDLSITKSKDGNKVEYKIEAKTTKDTKTFNMTLAQSNNNVVEVSGLSFVNNGTKKFAVASAKIERKTDGKKTTITVTDAKNVVVNKSGENEFDVNKMEIVVDNSVAGKTGITIKVIESTNNRLSGKTATVVWDKTNEKVSITIPNTERLSDIKIIAFQ